MGTSSLLGNLPPQLTVFIGRGAELAELRQTLLSARLVTLTGAGGTGKTRLAIEAAATAAAFGDGTWWVDLSQVDAEGLVPTVTAAALPFVEAPYRDATASLVEHLRPRRALLLLDNCEHVLEEAAAFVDGLLRACPGLTILTTSRQPLDVGGEVVWRVPSLSFPLAAATDPIDLLGYEAVRLFVERAARRSPGFALDAGNAEAVVAICRELDGLPLAIELAAARVGSLPLDRMVALLSERLDHLGRGPSWRLPRQRTLRASIDWSYGLLSEAERAVFRRLAVFRSGFTLEAARAVCGRILPDGSEVAALARLVDRCVVQAPDAVEGRYRMLEPVRRYAEEKLAKAGERDHARASHLEFSVGLVERLAPRLQEDAPGGLDAIERELDNLRAAFDCALDSGRADAAIRLAAGLLAFWMARYPLEGLARLEAAAGAGGAAPALAGRAFAALSFLRLYGEFDPWRALAEAKAALGIARQVGDQAVEAVALNHLGWAAVYAAPYEASTAFEASLQLNRRQGELSGAVHALAGLGFVSIHVGDLDRAEELFRQSLREARAAGHTIGVRRGLAFLGALMAVRGRLDGAEKLLEECLQLSRRLNDRYFIAHALDYLGLVSLHRGDHELAREDLEEALRNAQLASPLALARTLTHLGRLELASGDMDQARDRLEEAVRVSQQWQPNWYLAPAAPLLAEVLSLQGEQADARSLLDRALTAAGEQPWARALGRIGEAGLLRRRGRRAEATAAAHEALVTLTGLGCVPDALAALELFAALRAEDGSTEEALRLVGAADAWRERRQVRRHALDEDQIRALRASAETTLGHDRAERAVADGQRLAPGEAVAYASRGRGKRDRPPAGWRSLTPAERQVAALLAEGLSNAEIGRRLFLAPATVRVHLAHAYAKLGVRSRAQLAAEVTRRTAGGDR
ncbi:MAG TPA: LuxR C-terminal-related transcriptional regulator [Actinomycetes bacterium]|nr:LuxR C-terminal-related transcriptional regulator [Actinomycetes bacterium]